MEQAEHHPNQTVVFCVKNIEALDAGEWPKLLEVARSRELPDPENPGGFISLPQNLKIIFTQGSDSLAEVQDPSLYDRLVIKTWNIDANLVETTNIAETLAEPYIEKDNGASYLVLRDRTRIRLSNALNAKITERLSGADLEDFLDREANFILDDKGQKMLSEMQKTLDRKENMIILKGPTGRGKSNAVMAFALLTGRPYMVSPVTKGTSLDFFLDHYEPQRNGTLVYQDRAGASGASAGPGNRQQTGRSF